MRTFRVTKDLLALAISDLNQGSGRRYEIKLADGRCHPNNYRLWVDKDTQGPAEFCTGPVQAKVLYAEILKRMPK